MDEFTLVFNLAMDEYEQWTHLKESAFVWKERIAHNKESFSEKEDCGKKKKIEGISWPEAEVLGTEMGVLPLFVVAEPVVVLPPEW